MSVSVVIPAYNRAKRLPAAIDSVLRQGVPDTEIIVVDDGSVDETRGVLEQYGGRVRYVYQSNAGVGAARNTGIRQASREFVAFLDSDDRWLDAKLSRQLALFAARPDVGLVFSDFVIERSDGSEQDRGADRWAGRRLDFPDMTPLTLASPSSTEAVGSDAIQCWVGPMYAQLVNELPILTSSVIVRRRALDDRTWFTERVPLFEDWEFFARVARRWNVGYLTTPTTVNVGHLDPGRVSKCSSLDRAESYLSLLERVWLSDDEFRAARGPLVRSAHGRALLSVAREALLANRSDRARAVLERWTHAGHTERRGWAATYRACSRIPGGSVLLRNLLRGRSAISLMTATSAPGHDSVNPAA